MVDRAARAHALGECTPLAHMEVFSKGIYFYFIFHMFQKWSCFGLILFPPSFQYSITSISLLQAIGGRCRCGSGRSSTGSISISAHSLFCISTRLSPLFMLINIPPLAKLEATVFTLVRALATMYGAHVFGQRALVRK